MTTQDIQYDILIVGQGAAAYAAALYAARYQMKSVVFGGLFGGETGTGGLIENYPGYPEIDGLDLMFKLREQAEKYQVPIVSEDIVSITRAGDCFEATTEEGNVHQGASVILAVGRERRRLGLEREDEWTGRGISFCAICDAPLYRGKVVGVVGGGDAAVKGAALASKYAEQVYVIYRGDRGTGGRSRPLRPPSAPSPFFPLFPSPFLSFPFSSFIGGVVLDREYNGSNQFDLGALFLEIGADPRVDLPNQLGLELNERNEVKVDRSGRTNVEGILAAGDLTDASGDLKQTITAAAQGALAATAAYEYVSKHGNRCEPHAMAYSLA